MLYCSVCATLGELSWPGLKIRLLAKARRRSKASRKRTETPGNTLSPRSVEKGAVDDQNRRFQGFPPRLRDVREVAAEPRATPAGTGQVLGHAELHAEEAAVMRL